MEFENMISAGDDLLYFEKIVCHTLAVEWYVKVVAEAALSVSGLEARDDFMATKIRARLTNI